MPARIGADDVDAFSSPRPALLREIAGIEPERGGIHVLLDKHARVRSTQRLALGDVGGSVVAALWPGELKSQAMYLYSDGRALAMIGAARKRSWHIEPSPHLAFFNSSPTQRLYMRPSISPEEYALRWEGSDGRMIGRHPPEALTTTLRPWLERCGYLDDGDANVFEQFATILGRRSVDVRPGLRFKRQWSGDEPELAATIRGDVNAILAAGGEPTLPPPRPPLSRSSSSPVGAGLEVVRGRYMPDRIRILLLGESPPPGRGFFYTGDSTLFRATQPVLIRLCRFPQDAEASLTAFRTAGFYLDDFSAERGAKPHRTAQSAAVRQAVRRIAELIRRYRPDVVVPVLHEIAVLSNEAIELSGVAVPMRVLRFPYHRSSSALAEYQRGLSAVIKEFGCS